MDQLDSLISDEDIAERAVALEPNSSEAILVFEHTWAKPLRDAIVGASQNRQAGKQQWPRLLRPPRHRLRQRAAASWTS